ncbi:MAG: fimbria/pilus outer membrane usher protein [Gammaproteobacteria bacterium]
MSNTAVVAQTPLLVDVTVNHRHYGIAVLVQTSDDEFFASISDLSKWGVRGPYIDRITFDNREFARLRSLGNIGTTVDAQRASASLSIPPELLPDQSLTVGELERPDPVSSRGVYLDYDWSYTSGDSSYVTGLLAPTFFSELGVVDAQILYRDADSLFSDIGSDHSDWLRLNTTYTRDFPEKLRSLRIGDVINPSGPWGGASRVGGIQLASNFSTQPSFVTIPVPILEGVASVPSTLDLYVNGALRHRQNVDPGTFRVDEIPVVTGSGEMQMVVTDVLGREHVYSQSFYASAELLRQGLSEYSYTLGSLRRDFGQPSDRYDEAVAIAQHRYGINGELTVGGRAELSEEVRSATASADWSPDLNGVISAAFGLSQSDEGSGSAWLLGYRYQGRNFNFSSRISGTSEQFRVMGNELAGYVPETEVVLSGGWQHPRAGSFGAAIVRRSYHDDFQRDVLSFNYAKTLYRQYYLSVFASYANDQNSGASFGATVTRMFGQRRSASASVSREGERSQVRMETQSNLPAGPGLGYRFGTTLADDDRLDGQLIGQTEYGRYTAEINKFGDSTATRARASGSLAWLGGRAYAAREISDGFAVAKIGELENVRVYVENQVVGRSDKNGRVLLPRLRPYEVNRIRIEPADLPLASEISTVSVEVAPAYRNGLVIDFPVSTPSFAMVSAVLADGTAIPEGSTVQIFGKDESTIVGRDGAIFLAAPEGETRVNVYWRSSECEFDIEMPAATQALPHLGEITCKVAR